MSRGHRQDVRWLWRSFAAISLSTWSVALSSGAFAESGHADEALHFSHPLVAESPSPDTKVRLHYFFENDAGEEQDDIHTIHLETEYAFAPWVSVEADTPYVFLDPEQGKSRHDFGNLEVAVKFACFAFAESGLLFGGGLESEIPTGSESKGIGSDHAGEIAPFLDVGFKYGGLETVGFLTLGVPFNEDGHGGADLEIEWNLSFLYHVTPRLQAQLEFDGEEVFGGEEDGTTVVNITPGIKVAPFAGRNFQIGAGVTIPLTHDPHFDVRSVLAFFYHF